MLKRIQNFDIIIFCPWFDRSSNDKDHLVWRLISKEAPKTNPTSSLDSGSAGAAIHLAKFPAHRSLRLIDRKTGIASTWHSFHALFLLAGIDLGSSCDNNDCCGSSKFHLQPSIILFLVRLITAAWQDLFTYNLPCGDAMRWLPKMRLEARRCFCKQEHGCS